MGGDEYNYHDHASASARRRPRLLWLSSLAVGLAATALNLLISAVARQLFGVPATFAPFTLGPLITGCVGGALGVVTVFAVIDRVTKHPLPWLWAISVVLWVASVYLPLGLLDSTSPRFEGVSYPVVATLFLMHTVVAVFAVGQVTLRVRAARTRPGGGGRDTKC